MGREYLGDVCWTYESIRFRCVFASLRRILKKNLQKKLCCPKNYFQPQKYGIGSEWHSNKMTRLSNRHVSSFLQGGSLWHSDKMTRCVNLTQRQNDVVRHFGTEGHFCTATKCLSFIFFSNLILGFEVKLFF